MLQKVPINRIIVISGEWLTLSVLISSGHSSAYHTNLRENHVTRQDNFMSHGVYGPDLVHGPSLERK